MKTFRRRNKILSQHHFQDYLGKAHKSDNAAFFFFWSDYSVPLGHGSWVPQLPPHRTFVWAPHTCGEMRVLGHLPTMPQGQGIIIPCLGDKGDNAFICTEGVKSHCRMPLLSSAKGIGPRETAAHAQIALGRTGSQMG